MKKVQSFWSNVEIDHLLNSGVLGYSCLGVLQIIIRSLLCTHMETKGHDEQATNSPTEI